VVLRASRLNTDASQPLNAQVVEPGSGGVRSVTLAPSEARPGDWTARWIATSPGSLRANLQPQAGERLSAQTEVSVPAKERSSLVRDEAFLRQITAAGAGNYYATPAAALAETDGVPPLASATPSREETTVVFGQPDPRFVELVSRWSLGLIAGCLFLEWLVRRLNRLA
ncbi:MAG: hypothetical protein AAGG46_08440, partial [Planctomycetota bacterium]